MLIKHLPHPTQARLRSTQILSSLAQIVSELLQNSLDANALHIDIGVDCEEWACWVADDGVGISRDALDVLGEEADGGRYSTSKRYAEHTINALETFGFRGEALASIANLSCLEICSRTARSRDTWSVIVKGGKTLYNGSAVRWRRESSGTAVHIRDAFYNLPVRRRSHPPPARVLEQIRRNLEVHALMFPHVSFSLQNLHSQRGTGSSRDSTWRVPKTGSSLECFRHLYGKALAKHIEVISLVSGEMRLDGFISLTGAPSKIYQFLYVNKHFISHCDLHRAIDSVFAASAFHRNAPDEENEVATASRRPPRKGEKRPVYVLNLTLPPERIDNCVEPDKSAIHIQDASIVATFLASAIRGFLNCHGYLDGIPSSRTIDRTNLEPSQKKRKIQNEEDPQSMINGSRRFPGGTAPLVHLNHDSERQNWIDNRTGQTFIIDSRTGNTFTPEMARRKEMNLPFSDYRKQRRSIHSQSTTPDMHSIKQSINVTPPAWLKEALRNNSVYAHASNGIPVINTSYSGYESVIQRDETGLDSIGPSHRFERSDLSRAEVIGQVDRKFIACLIKGKMTPLESLESDEREKNVTDEPRLLLIDQHAADERVRVEHYLRELCQGFVDNRKQGKDSKNGVKVHCFEPPMPLLLTQYEGHKLAASCDLQQFFAWWGIRFHGLSEVEANGPEQEADSENSHEYLQVLVHCVPQVIRDKLAAKDELRDLVKGILNRLITGGLDSQVPGELGDCPLDEYAWLSGLRYCPQELLDLINSKACRGAIMFNDTLDLEQCRRLVSQLSGTAFPFQCAHGRPTLVPVANIAKSAPRRREVTINGWSRLEQRGG